MDMGTSYLPPRLLSYNNILLYAPKWRLQCNKNCFYDKMLLDLTSILSRASCCASLNCLDFSPLVSRLAESWKGLIIVSCQFSWNKNNYFNNFIKLCYVDQNLIIKHIGQVKHKMTCLIEFSPGFIKFLVINCVFQGSSHFIPLLILS